jgi:hypothetical protein
MKILSNNGGKSKNTSTSKRKPRNNRIKKKSKQAKQTLHNSLQSNGNRRPLKNTADSVTTVD